MPFVGQQVTGDPKRLFVAAKDQIVFNVPDQQQSSMTAIKDGFTQVERAINTRAVSAKTRNGANTVFGLGAVTLPMGTKLWDTGTIIQTNRMLIGETGIYDCQCSLTINGTASAAYIISIRHFNNAGTQQPDSELNNAFVPAAGGAVGTQIVAQLNCAYRDYLQIQIGFGAGGAAGDSASIFSFAITKIANQPNPAGI